MMYGCYIIIVIAMEITKTLRSMEPHPPTPTPHHFYTYFYRIYNYFIPSIHHLHHFRLRSTQLKYVGYSDSLS